MYAQGVVNGVGNGQFAPNYNITRAQFAAILVRALGIPLNAESNNGDIFTDVNGTDWFASAVAAAYNVGLIRGYNGYFRPNDEVSRQEMAIMLMTALEYMGFENDNYADLSSFNDASSIADWAYNATSGAVGAGLMSGIGNGEFSPRTSATRAQATVVISRLLDLRD
ncbi:MAG: S-layer homology domain-containing protein [Oscillospiraceae bacterium]|nr:S-layer homology domain-containing protein [Oscillospiraceae bacterium]